MNKTQLAAQIVDLWDTQLATYLATGKDTREEAIRYLAHKKTKLELEKQLAHTQARDAEWSER